MTECFYTIAKGIVNTVCYISDLLLFQEPMHKQIPSVVNGDETQVTKIFDIYFKLFRGSYQKLSSAKYQMNVQVGKKITLDIENISQIEGLQIKIIMFKVFTNK